MILAVLADRQGRSRFAKRTNSWSTMVWNRKPLWTFMIAALGD